jgi:hypothetical protein
LVNDNNKGLFPITEENTEKQRRGGLHHVRAILNPDLYHGYNKKNNFFEGWYFKIVDRTGKHRFAFIPGIFKGENNSASHSFLQIIDGAAPDYNYLTFPTSDFWAHEKQFRISVARNHFSLEGFELDIEQEGQQIQGKIKLDNRLTWPDTWYRPGSMGYYNFFTFMQCYSQVCCMYADLTGMLTINGQQVDFTGGTAYIEKKWGRDFPHGWVWVQANNFAQSTASISCSVGHIPFLHTTFRGFLIGLSYADAFYSFTTINRSTLHISKNNDTCCMTAKNKIHRLQVTSSAAPSSFVQCKGPRDDTMQPLVDESISGTVEVVLTREGTGETIFADTSHSGGIEYGGNQNLVLKN